MPIFDFIGQMINIKEIIYVIMGLCFYMLNFCVKSVIR